MTPLSMVPSQALQSIYLNAVSKTARAISLNCMEAIGQMAKSFMVWPDATRVGLMVQPSRLPHAYAACGTPVLVGIDMLSRQGVQPVLLASIVTAHQAALIQAPVR